MSGWSRDNEGRVLFELELYIDGADRAALAKRLLDRERKPRIFPDGMFPRGVTLLFRPYAPWCDKCDRAGQHPRVAVVWRPEIKDRLDDRAIYPFMRVVEGRFRRVLREALRLEALREAAAS